jgi:hypothetical protein
MVCEKSIVYFGLKRIKFSCDKLSNKQIVFLMLDGNGGNASTYWKIGCLDGSSQTFLPINTYQEINQTQFPLDCAAMFNYT